jgi:hypothetical protein
LSTKKYQRGVNYFFILLLPFRGFCGLITSMNDTTVIIQPKLTATNRTKDRIRQHGTPRGKDFKDGRGCAMAFTLMRRTDNAWPPSWLLQAEDGWLGWIPRNEIDCLNDTWRSLHKDS